MPAWLEKILALVIFIAVMTFAGIYWRKAIDGMSSYAIDIGLSVGIALLIGFWIGRWDMRRELLKTARAYTKPKQDSRDNFIDL